MAKDKCLCGLFNDCIPGCVYSEGNNMSVKVPQEYADYDFDTFDAVATDGDLWESVTIEKKS